MNDPAAPGGRRWLVLRRSCTDPTEVRAYRAYGPEATPLDTQVRVIGKRWTVEERIQTGTSEVGLDECEVRAWTGWYRHSTLAMWAHAVLRVLRHQESAVEAPKKGSLPIAGAHSLARFKARRGCGAGEQWEGSSALWCGLSSKAVWRAVRVSSGEGRQL